MLANSVLWAAADAQTVSPAWLSGWKGTQDKKLLNAARSAGLTGIEKPEAQRQCDRLIGNAGVAGGWLSIAAALEAGPGGLRDRHQPDFAGGGAQEPRDVARGARLMRSTVRRQAL